MVRNIKVGIIKEMRVLLTDVTYSNVPYWYNSTEHALRMSLILPMHRENHRPLPLFLWFTGGAFQVIDKDVLIPYISGIADQGFIVASAEYRTIDNAPFPASLIDAKAAIRYLRAHKEQYCIDDRYIFVGGESAGGMLACQAGVLQNRPEYEQGDFTDQSSRVSAVVDFYGSRITGESSDPMVRAAYRQYLGLGRENWKEIAETAAPVHYVTDRTVPFLIFHGTADSVVGIDTSEELYNALVSHGVYSEYYRLEGAEHGADEFYQPECMKIVVDFMRKVMAGV